MNKSIKNGKQKEPKTKEEIIYYISSLAEKACKLRKRADEMEVIPRYRILTTRIPKARLAMDRPLIYKMPKKDKKKLLRSHKFILTLLVNYFRITLKTIDRYPNLWKKLKNDTAKLAKILEQVKKYESKLFQAKKF